MFLRRSFRGKSSSNPRASNIKTLEKVSTRRKANGIVRSSERQPLSALAESRRVQDEAALAGFDWDNVNGPIEKIIEETGELVNALEAGDIELAENELGDIMFSVVNAARHMNVDTEHALRIATERFSMRFNRVRTLLEEQGHDLCDCSLDLMSKAWEQAKREAAEKL